jgi:23S rRNA (cytidine1920-2'-O)/16S rRNA (cytidine1409-2'-O)-methyltransferase
MKTVKKSVADLLLEQGLVPSRQAAEALVLARKVRINGAFAQKPGQLVSGQAKLEVLADAAYASRAGDKLAGALDDFKLSVKDFVCADVGASTGGFTSVLLDRGANKVYAIDVAYGELDWSLRQDVRVVVMERTNARHLEALPEQVDLVTLDLSFISLKLVVPMAQKWLKPAGLVLAMIKPQFEAARGLVPPGGVIVDPAVHRLVLEDFLSWAEKAGAGVSALSASRVKGLHGNREFFACLRPQNASSCDWRTQIPGLLAPDID